MILDTDIKFPGWSLVFFLPSGSGSDQDPMKDGLGCAGWELHTQEVDGRAHLNV